MPRSPAKPPRTSIGWRSAIPIPDPSSLHHDMLVTDPFMHRLVGDARLLDIVEQFIGPDIAMYAAHYIAKPPRHGQEVLWHQDGSYWPLEPMEVTTIWLAASASTRENGCMRVLPGTQNNRLLSRREMIDVPDGKNVLSSGIHPSQIDDSQVVDLELEPGDVSIHNPRIIHGSQPNPSDSWRIGSNPALHPDIDLGQAGYPCQHILARRNRSEGE